MCSAISDSLQHVILKLLGLSLQHVVMRLLEEASTSSLWEGSLVFSASYVVMG